MMLRFALLNLVLASPAMGAEKELALASYCTFSSKCALNERNCTTSQRKLSLRVFGFLVRYQIEQADGSSRLEAAMEGWSSEASIDYEGRHLNGVFGMPGHTLYLSKMTKQSYGFYARSKRYELWELHVAASGKAKLTVSEGKDVKDRYTLFGSCTYELADLKVAG